MLAHLAEPVTVGQMTDKATMSGAVSTAIS